MRKNIFILFTVSLSLSSLLYGDIIISTPTNTTLNSNGTENIYITPTGSITINTNSSNSAIKLWGTNLQSGKEIINNGQISTNLLTNGGGGYSLSILIYGQVYGKIENNAIISTQVSDGGKLGYPIYVQTNALGGSITNNGQLKSDVGDGSWGVGMNIRTNNSIIHNTSSGSIIINGTNDAWLYGIAVINNNTNADITNDGTISLSNNGINGGSTGIYATNNDASVSNSGTISLQATDQNSELYGISITGNNNGTILNLGTIQIDNVPDSIMVYSFNTGGGTGTIINGTGAYAYGNINAIGQLLENRGKLYLHDKTSSIADIYHAYPGSFLGIKVDLDNNNNPVYSNIETRKSILEDGSGIFVDVETLPSQHYSYIGKTLYDVIHTTDGLTINGDIVVEDNSVLLRFIPIYDNLTLDLTIEKAISIERAVKEGQCNKSAWGAAKGLDAYQYGNNSDIDRLITALFTATDLQSIGDIVSSSTPLSSVQNIYASLHTSSVLREHIQHHIKTSFFGDINNTDIWIQALDIRQRQTCSNGYAGYDLALHGAIIGMDHQWTERHTSGVAMSLSKGDLRSYGVDQKENIERYDIILYGKYLLPYQWTGIYELSIGRQQNHVYRSIPETYDHKYATYHNDMFSSYLELDHILMTTQHTTLYVGGYLSYAYVDTKAYTESGAGGLNISLGDTVGRSLRSGLKLGTSYHQKNITAGLDIGIDRDFYNHPITGYATYSGGLPYTILLDYDTPWNFSLNFSMQAVITDTISLDLYYGLLATQSSYKNHTLSASLSWHF